MTITLYTGSLKYIPAILFLDWKQKQILPGGNHPSSTANRGDLAYPFPRLGWYFFPAKVTGKDNSTFTCSHLMAELSVLADWKSTKWW